MEKSKGVEFERQRHSHSLEENTSRSRERRRILNGLSSLRRRRSRETREAADSRCVFEREAGLVTRARIETAEDRQGALGGISRAPLPMRLWSSRDADETQGHATRMPGLISLGLDPILHHHSSNHPTDCRHDKKEESECGAVSLSCES